MANTQQGKGDTDETRNPKPDAGAKVSSDRGDGRGDKREQKKNQQQLGIDAEHQTHSMKKHHRGTFP